MLKCRMTEFQCFVMLVVLIFSQALLVGAKFMPAVLWDPRNPLFNCPSRVNNTIQVRMKDYMQFVCPTSNSNLGMQNSQLNYDSLHEVAYFLYPENKQDALNCNATVCPRPFFTCDTTKKSNGGATIRIASVSGDPHAPLFDYGKTYYIIGTGNGLHSGLTNKVGGHCSHSETYPENKYRMILKLKVCSKEDEFVHKNCTVCKDVGCYNKDCGIYREWQKWEYFHNISKVSKENSTNTISGNEYFDATNCFKRRQRTCPNEVTGCAGPSEEVEEIACPKINMPTQYNNCSEWLNDFSLTGGVIQKRNCTISNIEEMVITQFKIVKNTKEPTAAKSEGIENNLVTVSIQVFILCILGPVILLAVGVLIGYFWRRSKGKRKQPFYDMPRRKNKFPSV